MVITTALDSQNLLISLLANDSLIAATFPGLSILSYDPTGVEPDAGAYVLDGVTSSGVALAVDLATEGDEDGSLGGPTAGTRTFCDTFGIIVYIWADQRDARKKADLVRLTGTVREALMHYRVGQSGNNQLWYKSGFGVPATKYHYITGARLSVTNFQLFCRRRTQ